MENQARLADESGFFLWFRRWEVGQFPEVNGGYLGGIGGDGWVGEDLS